MSEFLQQLINGIAWGSIYALIALGYTMVYGVLRLINFAHGDVYMVGAFAGFYAVKWVGLAQEPTIFGAVAIFLLSMGCCGILGFVIERGAYKPLRKAPRLTALITAIGVSLFLENAGQLIFGADPKFFPQIIAKKDVISSGGIILTNQQVIVLVVSLFLMASLQLFIMRTKTGKAMRAVSFNREAASLMGISVDRIISITFVLGSALAGAAAILTNPKIEPLMGIMPGIKAFVAAVLGGIGNVPGAMIGGMIMGIAEVMVVGYLSSTYRDAIAFAILILILLFKPSGLLGGFTGEKV
jgi:branched-chain amino acid transport system permease protein